MIESSKNALDELRASLEAQINPMQVIKDELAALKELRAQAMAQGRYDIVASIDLRRQELDLMQQQYILMKKRYSEEGSALTLLHNKLDISKQKAKELLALFAKKAGADDLTDLELAKLIIKKRKGRASGGPVGAGMTYLVGEQGPELLTMGASNGYVTPNNKLGGGGGGNVYLDGYLVGKLIDERLGRQYGTASRVTNYRRS